MPLIGNRGWKQEKKPVHLKKFEQNRAGLDGEAHKVSKEQMITSKW